MTIQPQDMYDEILRQDFAAFVHRAFVELYPQHIYLPNFHIDVLAAAVADIMNSKCLRLIACMPPRHLKSFVLSVALPAFLLGHNASAQIICASYGQDLADKFARDCRTLMSSPFYKRIFATRLSPDKSAVSEFETMVGGYRLSTSVGGPMTGRGCDYLIIDDPLKANEAYSDAARNACNDWFDGTALTRITNKTTGVIVVVQQRLHEGDLIGHLLERGGWKLLSFPAIATEDEIFEIDTPYGRQTFVRHEGDVLHPQRESRETLAAQRSTMGDWAFEAQYQQSPTPRGGAMVKAASFNYYTDAELPTSFDYKVISCDTAMKATELADYSALIVCGVKGPHYFLLDVVRGKLNYPDLKTVIKNLILNYQVATTVIEDHGSGTSLIADLTQEGVHGVVGFKPEGDKVIRLHAQTATIAQGFVYLPKAAPWVSAFLHEVTSFPNGKKDDQVDALTQLLAWAKQPDSWRNWMEYMKGELAEQKAKSADSIPVGANIRMQAPPSVIGVTTYLKRHLWLDPDGTGLFTEEEARDLLQQGWSRA